MSTGAEQPPKKLPVVPLAAAALLFGAAACLLFRHLDYQGLLAQGAALIRRAGPGTYFAAAVLLPAAGAPLSAFTLTAGELFGPTLTLPGVIAAMLAAIWINLALTYWLARYALRPLVLRVITRYGYRIPTVTASTALSITMALRLTPGPPFFLQSYILGMAETPFWTYMIASWLCVLPWSLGALILGKGAFNGNFRLLAIGAAVIAIAVVVIQQVRKRYAPKPG